MTSSSAERAYLLGRTSAPIPAVPLGAGAAKSHPGGNQQLLSKLAWIAAGSSLVIHVVLLLIMTAWLLNQRRQTTPGVIQTRLVDDSFPTETFTRVEVEQIEIAPVESDAPQVKNPAELAGSEFQPSLAAVNLAVAGPGQADPSGSEVGGRVEFFGTGAAGNSFVFVVDCSGSMEGVRFHRAVLELRGSLRQLDRGQEFFIVFYNDEAIPLFQPRELNGLLPVTNAMRKRASRWIKNQRASGGTRPEEAVRIALALKPDVIYLLTDGEIPAETREVAHDFNLYDSVIHTIAFQTRSGEAILKGIAKDNHGRYRFVE